MSSHSELQFAVESEEAHRVPLDVETIMRTGYEIDHFQRVYFVLPSFDALVAQMEAADIPALIRAHKDEAPLDPAGLS